MLINQIICNTCGEPRTDYNPRTDYKRIKSYPLCTLYSLPFYCLKFEMFTFLYFVSKIAFLINQITFSYNFLF